MDRLLHDIRIGLRSLRRTPGFVLTAVLLLALGIGLSTAVFTVANALLLRRLPVRDQDRLVVLWGESRDGSFANYPLGFDEALEFERQARSVERVALFRYDGSSPVSVREGDRITRLRRALVSGEFFDVLGTQPEIGRGLRPEDDVRGAAPVVVLSHSAWQRRFGGDVHVLGRRVLLQDDGVAYTIVGVMPAGLDYPRGTDFWAAIVPGMPQEVLPLMAFNVVGRLVPGATPAEARDEMTAFFQRPAAEPWERELRGVENTLPRLVLGEARPALIAFAAAAALLLVITCINAPTFSGCGFGRMREIAGDPRSGRDADRSCGSC
jgi:hypothetical protein